MIQRTIKRIAEMIKIENDISSFENIEITGVSINSKTIERGNLFIPIKGENRDGHEFVEQAIESGAHASLWQKDTPNPPINLPLIIVENTVEAMQQLAYAYRNELSLKVAGVTGSNGKTTTKDILAELLSLKYKVHKTIGNFNNHLGLPLTILGMKSDTEVAVLEMGMDHFGEIDLLTRIALPDAAIITNIGEAHLQELGSRDGISRAKLEILNGLKKNGLFVYPGEEPLIKEKIEKNHEDWIIKTFGRGEENDFYPVSIKMSDSSSIFKTNQSDVLFEMPVLGEYNVLNALAAMLVANFWGVPFEKMNEAFSKLKLSNMRMEMLQGLNGSKVINDAYNASPTSTKAVLELISNLDGYRKKIAVLGDMLELGPEEEKYHRELGAAIESDKIDYVFTFGPLAKLLAEEAANNLGADRVFPFENKSDLVEHLKEKLNGNTLVVVKASRGMKLEEVAKAITAGDNPQN